MIPQLRFPEFTDEWQVKKLGEIVDIVDGDRGVNYPKQRDFTKAGYCLFLNASNVTKSGFDFKEKQFISTEKDKALNKGKLSREDVVLTTRGTVGNFAYYSDEVPYDQVRINSGMVLLRAGSDVAPGYLHSSSSYFDKQIKSIAFGSAQPQLTVGAIKKLKLPMPSKPEQEKIADFLTAVDERIAVGEKKLELLETYKRGVMQKIFSQQVLFKDANGNPYPDWEEKKLGEIEDEGLIKLGRGNVISKVDIKDYPGEYPIYSSSVKNDGLFGKYGKYMFDEELVTWSVDGGGDFFYRPSQKFSITNVSGWLRVLSGTINCKFLATQLQMLHERQKFDYTSKAHPSVIRNIYTVKIPAIEEQQKIATFLTALDEKITAEKSKLTAARQFKKALLQRMFV